MERTLRKGNFHRNKFLWMQHRGWPPKQDAQSVTAKRDETSLERRGRAQRKHKNNAHNRANAHNPTNTLFIVGKNRGEIKHRITSKPIVTQSPKRRDATKENKRKPE